MSCDQNPVPKMFLGRKIASKWVKNYQTIKKTQLDPTASNPVIGDTKAIWYSIDKWQELMREATCQGATGLRMYFAAYSDKADSTLGEIIPPEANKNLTAIFVFTKTTAAGIEQDFFIEEEPGFPNRPTLMFPTNNQSTIPNTKGAAPINERNTDFDTGNPCPPAVGCSLGALLP